MSLLLFHGSVSLLGGVSVPRTIGVCVFYPHVESRSSRLRFPAPETRRSKGRVGLKSPVLERTGVIVIVIRPNTEVLLDFSLLAYAYKLV